MNDNIREAISALADGESKANVPALVDKLIHDPQMRAAWERYHLIGDALAERLPERLAIRLMDGVQADIAAEQVVLFAPRRARLQKFLKPVAGFALAASVASVAILGVRTLERDASPDVDVAVAAPEAAVITTGNRWSTAQPDVAARLNDYLVNHSEYVGYGMRGMLPYARIVGYDTSE